MINVGKVEMVNLNSIIVSDRARQEMGDLDGLEKSMKESGLISPLALKSNNNGTYTLLAGGRRLEVLKRNNVELISAKIYEEELSDMEMKVIEKSENFYRKDMEYWEMDKLTLEIHQMQQELHGVKSPGPGQTGWSVSDTGDMIGYTKGSVSAAIKRAEAREIMPEIFTSCKTASDASKVIKKLDEALIRETVANKLAGQKSDTKLSQLSKCFIIKDFFDGVKEIPDGIMHLVEIDPPYGINLDKLKKYDNPSQQLCTANYNEVPQENYQSFLTKTFKECYRVMAPHSWLICWFAPEPWFEVVYQELKNAGFSTSRMCGVWVKNLGQSKRPQTRLANAYEMFFYACKGTPVLNKPGHLNVFNFAPVPANRKVHPTERPVDLMRELYSTFAFPGSRLLIPFLGSGSGLFAAHDVGLSAVGFELSKSYKDSFIVKASNM